MAIPREETRRREGEELEVAEETEREKRRRGRTE